MKKNESIKSIMSTELVCGTTQSKISEIKTMMQESKIRHVPIISGKKLVGLISQVDILGSSFSNVFLDDDQTTNDQLDHTATVEQIMTKDLNTIHESETVREGALRLMSASFNSLPVVNDSEELVGIVTSKDLIRYLIEQY